MVESVVLGESGACLQLVQDQIHLAPPLHILGYWVVVLQLPDAAEAGEQLRAGGVAIEDRGAEESEEEGRGKEKKIVEVGVRIREEGFLTLRAEIHPVTGTVGTGWPPLAATRHAGQSCCSKEDTEYCQTKEEDKSSKDSI